MGFRSAVALALRTVLQPRDHNSRLRGRRTSGIWPHPWGVIRSSLGGPQLANTGHHGTCTIGRDPYCPNIASRVSEKKFVKREAKSNHNSLWFPEPVSNPIERAARERKPADNFSRRALAPGYETNSPSARPTLGRSGHFDSSARSEHRIRWRLLSQFWRVSELASGHTGNVVPGNRLRVRVPCPPLGDSSDNCVCCCWWGSLTLPSPRGRWFAVGRSCESCYFVSAGRLILKLVSGFSSRSSRRRRSRWRRRR